MSHVNGVNDGKTECYKLIPLLLFCDSEPGKCIVGFLIARI